MLIATNPSASGGAVRHDAAQAARLDARIGPANPERYKGIREATDWANPYLIVRYDGVEVIAKGLTDGRRLVAAADVGRTLVDLPVSAWPYGRVVAIQEVGIRRGDGDDQPAVADNLKVTIANVMVLNVTVERWPS